MGNKQEIRETYGYINQYNIMHEPYLDHDLKK